MPIDLYPNIAKIKRNGAYQNLPGFVQQNSNADIKAMIANSESTTTAQYAHPKDSYFILNDVLYKAIINIAINDSIAVGTNCEVAVLANDFSDFYSSVSDNVVRDITTFSPEFEQGTISNTYKEAANAKRIRTVDTFDVSTFEVAECDSNHVIWQAEFTATMAGNRLVTSGSRTRVTKASLLPTTKYIRFILVNKNSATNITPSDNYTFTITMEALNR